MNKISSHHPTPSVRAAGDCSRMMQASRSALKAIGLVVGICAWYFGLMFVSAGFAGAGHGSYFFLSVLLAPFSASETIAPAGFALWPALAVLLTLRRFPVCRIAAIAVLTLHYVGMFIVSSQTDWSYVSKVCRAMPGLVVGFLLAYVVSQVFMWFWILRRNDADQLIAAANP